MSLLQAKFEKEPEDYRISLFLNSKVFQCFEIVNSLSGLESADFVQSVVLILR